MCGSTESAHRRREPFGTLNACPESFGTLRTGSAEGAGSRPARRGLRVAWALLVACALPAAAGCAVRVLEIDSDPPGARVFLDGRAAGNAPLALPFTHYGTRRLALELPGCEAVETSLELDAPWFGWFPLDFFAEHLWPGGVSDRWRVRATLLRRAPPTDAELEALYQRGRAAAGATPAAAPPAGAGEP